MPLSRSYSRFCGIDVAKCKHVACILDRDGEALVKSQSFTNDQDGYQRIAERLGQVGGPPEVLIGLEATGSYWYSLHDWLTEAGYRVAVLNPLQTAMQAKQGIRKAKTDKIDARHIATLLKNGDWKAALVPSSLAMTCRQLARLRYAFIRQSTRTKQQLWAHLHPVWPEYEALFADPFAATGRKLLQTAPTPADVLALDAQQLTDLIRSASRGQYGTAQADQVHEAATRSIGTRRCLEGTRAAIRLLLTQLEGQLQLRQELEAQIVALANRLPGYLLTLPGSSSFSAVSLFGETDPIETFRSPDQLVAFAGLDPKVFQTGQYSAPRRHISKRGSPVLRHTLWHMAHRAVYQQGDLRNYWLRKRGQGLHYLAAVTAATVKLCHIAWRILTDRRDYLPEAPPRNS